MDTVFPRLAQLIATNFGIPEKQITPDTTFEDLEFDSLALVELAVTVKGQFGVEIEEDAVTVEDTLSRVAELIEIIGIKA
jgi:acyl carrier protein